jgi:hypothetical protein
MLREFAHPRVPTSAETWEIAVLKRFACAKQARHTRCSTTEANSHTGALSCLKKATLKRAAADKRAGKSPSTRAGEFVKEEIDHVREGKHEKHEAGDRDRPVEGAPLGCRAEAAEGGHDERSHPQAGCCGSRCGQAEDACREAHATAKKATKSTAARRPSSESTAKRSRVTTGVLKGESGTAASKSALSKQTKTAAARRPAASRSAAAKKAVATKGAAARSAAAKKAAHTRAARAHH